ncbi:MAG: hypothetical protein WBM07_17315, partial [Chitinivibrionales bacterium]
MFTEAPAMVSVTAKATIMIFVAFAGQRVIAAADDYLWLHVDGKYIKTSPVADPPNQIFVAAG